MTVAEYDRIELVFVSSTNRVVLGMTEERPYVAGSSLDLDEDFRRKINTYIDAARSGHAAAVYRVNGDSRTHGVDIVLYSRTRPSDVVLHLIERVNGELAADDIRARWESIASNDIGVDVVEHALVTESLRTVGSDRRAALMWVVLIGRDGAAGVQVEHGDGSIADVAASDGLLALLSEHRHVSVRTGRGAWLSGRILIENGQDYTCRFSTTDLPEWMPLPGAPRRPGRVGSARTI
ncbi:hypothetical protein [Nocardia sp. R6R-6]|uniref:hypothetical protein n=1 Tax=Nocardia sp. R6R-6 TaxID=3459303 RepID=UPI00403DD069